MRRFLSPSLGRYAVAVCRREEGPFRAASAPVEVRPGAIAGVGTITVVD